MSWRWKLDAEPAGAMRVSCSPVAQEVHCLEVSFLCWALFEGVKEAKDARRGRASPERALSPASRGRPETGPCLALD